jgi:RAD50-interacting protein 1
LGKVDSTPNSAIPPYKVLRNIASSLKTAQIAAEGAAPHLIDYVENLATSVKKQLQDRFSGQLQHALDKLKWPNRDLVLNDGFIKEWLESVDLLLDLQEPYVSPSLPTEQHTDSHVWSNSDLKTYSESIVSSHAGESQVLLPLQVMVHPLELRFKYHFSGAKPTNRLDKVSFFFNFWNIGD